ncbi:MAG: EF-P lysine aminoacylase GenX [Alphaproteobacteria bacterium]|nr:EF-P lysine aminoacylase GenX [Alphaproteobacteria bacterium]
MQNKWWETDVYMTKLSNLKARNKVMYAIRDFFNNQGFLEVETPVLQISPGLEPHLKAFGTKIEHPLVDCDEGDNSAYKAKESDMYLHTSPEFSMKKLLVAGLPKIFQMARVFRNGERSNTHHPEFTMLEWYRAGEDYISLMDDCEGLFKSAAEAVGVKEFRYKQNVSSPFDTWERISVAEAFEKYSGIDLFATIADGDDVDPNPAKLIAEAKRIGINASNGDRWDDVFFKVFLEFIEPKLGFGAPTILYDYPICMAALSRAKPSNPRVAERFEVYVCGMELANAFSELTDADVQQKRFESDMDLKEKLYGNRYPIDGDFIDALKHGMPESAGIALGIDRLVMLVVGADDINDVLWVSVGKR